MHNQPREPQPYEDCQAKLIQELNFTRNGLRLGSRHQEPPHTDVSRNLATVVVRGVLPGLREEELDCCPVAKVLFSDESRSCISFRNKVLESGGRVEKLIAQVAWSSVLSLHSLWWFGVQCHLLVLVHHGVGVLDWPANSPDLNPIQNLWGIFKRKMRNKRPKNADELKATVKETWASIPPQQCHKLITSMSRRIEAVIKAKGAPTKYWVHMKSSFPKRYKSILIVFMKMTFFYLDPYILLIFNLSC